MVALPLRPHHRFCFENPIAAKFGTSETGNQARADDTDPGERLGGVHAVLYPPAIAVLKRGEGGGGGVGIKGGIKQAGRKGKSLCVNGLMQGSIPPAPASSNVLNSLPK